MIKWLKEKGIYLFISIVINAIVFHGLYHMEFPLPDLSDGQEKIITIKTIAIDDFKYPLPENYRSEEKPKPTSENQKPLIGNNAPAYSDPSLSGNLKSWALAWNGILNPDPGLNLNPKGIDPNRPSLTFKKAESQWTGRDYFKTAPNFNLYKYLKPAPSGSGKQPYSLPSKTIDTGSNPSLYYTMSQSKQPADIQPWANGIIASIMERLEPQTRQTPFPLGFIKIELEITRKGELSALSIIKSSFSAFYTDLITTSIKQCSPFNPLPSDNHHDPMNAIIVLNCQ